MVRKGKGTSVVFIRMSDLIALMYGDYIALTYGNPSPSVLNCKYLTQNGSLSGRLKTVMRLYSPIPGVSPVFTDETEVVAQIHCG